MFLILASFGVLHSPVYLMPNTYDFSSCFFPKFKVMHFQNGDIKLYTVVLLFLCFLKILRKLCCRWSWSRRSTVNNCRVREFQVVVTQRSRQHIL